ncbi:Vms1/Ankzf1 family peptidyl-tRNA hydrolase [Herbiconiux sp.]|jgi:hypothetical protein|uniref:baeRF2 domain-containing protein n=1 Tax=Herbiconiux sp. TaxID=1871186 RepID=UPI0025C0026B|nr:Vms1/Ankzf1 family peptidyl-tRNA hydrolase [Herbiconiux sp.]
MSDVYRRTGPWCQVYLDVSVDTGDPPSVIEERRISVVDRLRAQNASDADVDAVVDAMATLRGEGGEHCLYLLVNGGEIVVEELLPGRAVEPESVVVGPVPDLVPLFEHRPPEIRCLVVETGRDGGEITLYRLGASAPEQREAHQGRTDTLKKVQAGGWRHDRFQNHAEEIWRQTQAELAEMVDRIVRERRPSLLVVSGDVRARQLLEQELAEESRRLLSVLPVDTRSEGSNPAALDEHIEHEIARLLAERKDEAADLIALHAGRGDNEVETTVGGVVHALASAQVDTLLLDTDRLRDRELLALAAEPWLAASPEEALGAEVLASVPAPVALVRAAVLTDASVLFTDSRRVPDDVDLVEPPTGSGVAALLRWPTGPAVPR